MNPWVVSISIAYLLGSIPFGYLLVRLFRNEDVREQGSGNIGATNVARSGGTKLGVVTLLLDMGKAFAAVVIARHLAARLYAVRRVRRAGGRGGVRLLWGMCFRCGWDSAEARAWPARWASFWR